MATTRKSIKKTMTTFNSDDNRTITTYIITAQECSHFVAHPTVQRGIDYTYARKLMRSLVDNSALGFSPIGCLLTVQQDGRELVFDGQHRLYAITEVINSLASAEQAHKEAVDLYEKLNKERNDLLHSGGEVDLKRYIGLKHPGEYTPDPEYVTFLKSPVTVVRYEGEWSEVQLRELFAAFNSGKRVNTNLITAFANENNELVQDLANRGWIGKYIEDKGGKNRAIYGVVDVVRMEGKLGQEVTLAYLDALFSQYDEYDRGQREQLETLRLYGGSSKSLGTSVRMLSAVTKALMTVTDSTHMEHSVAVCVAAARKLMADPIECNKHLPGVYVPSKTGFSLTSATVVEGLIYPWLLWQLVQANINIELPKQYLNKLTELDTSFEQIEGTPITDVIELLSTKLPKPKVKAPNTRTFKPMSLPNKAAEQIALDLELDLDPNTIEL